jgi:tetratricopeptide (TPR) repeat protein
MTHQNEYEGHDATKADRATIDPSPHLGTTKDAQDGEVDLRGAKGVQVNPPGAVGTQTNIFKLPPKPPVSWPLAVGGIPALASAFQPRPGLRERIAAARAASGGTAGDGTAGGRGAGVVLTQWLTGGGGVGKSQLAASYADQALREGTDLVVWADAAAPGGMIAAYARAASRVQAPGASGDPCDVEADARAFLDWAATTKKSWLVVLDDITDPAQAAGWWPDRATGTGWVLATTRRRGSLLSGGGRQVVDVDVYSKEEAVAYLTERLTGAGKAHLLDNQAGDLAEALGWLPLALSHAAAYMIDQRVSCGAYLDLYTAQVEKLDKLMPGDPDGHGRTPDGHTRRITVTLLLALDAADTCEPIGLARPAMDLAAVLDPAGHPEALWATDAACTYLTAHRTPTARDKQQDGVTPRQASAAILLLDRYSLAAFNEQAGPRTVRVHAVTARAARETADNQVPHAAQAAAAARAAADAILELWPDDEHRHQELTAALRTNAAALVAHAGDALWTSDGAHRLIRRAGWSFIDAGLHTASLSFTRRVAADAARLLEPDHPDALAIQVNLGASHFLAGLIREAVTFLEPVLAKTRQLLGPDNPDTIKAQLHLAFAYSHAGRRSEAAALLETVVATQTRLLGPGHADTLAAQRSLGTIYTEDGRTGEAIALLEPVTLQMLQLLGPDNADTLWAQASLASAYLRARRPEAAVALLEPARVVARTRQLLGPDHAETLTTQSILAVAYGQTGRLEEAIALLESVTDIRLRLHGAKHPSTLNAQHDLAAAYRQAGRVSEAVALMERVVDVAVRTLGPEDPNTLRAREGLAFSYVLACRVDEGMTILERVAADRTRILGPSHPDTVAVVSTLRQLLMW